MQFEGEVDLGKELALLHRLLVENLKEMNEVLVISFVVEALCSRLSRVFPSQVIIIFNIVYFYMNFTFFTWCNQTCLST